MIVRLLPTQIPKFWDLVKPAVIEVGGKISPGDWDLANNVFNLCLSGLYQVWITSESEQIQDINGVVITCVSNDNASKETYLSLWLIFFYKQPSMDIIREAREATKLYANANSCKVIQVQQLHSMTDQIVDKWWEGKWSKKSIYTLYI